MGAAGVAVARAGVAVPVLVRRVEGVGRCTEAEGVREPQPPPLGVTVAVLPPAGREGVMEALGEGEGGVEGESAPSAPPEGVGRGVGEAVPPALTVSVGGLVGVGMGGEGVGDPLPLPLPPPTVCVAGREALGPALAVSPHWDGVSRGVAEAPRGVGEG